ncbi:MAG: hypothetical protein EAX95_16095 [Candidatus Thorarchaeota archaeon]|nr:hypothetical protein [Candidatus Thorarchaeota archaeon]
MSSFYPISPLVGITNTSYAAQAGVMEEKWACRVVRGKKILVEKTINDLDLEAYVGVIYGHIRVEGLSRHAVAVCAGRLMQFSRQYQQSGVSPNFEVPDLHYDDGSTPTEFPSDSAGSLSSTVSATEPIEESISVSPVGALPQLSPSVGLDLWSNTIQSYSVLLSQMAIYVAELPQGHLALIFDRVAEGLVRLWSKTGEGVDMLTSFANEILSCSKEGQLPASGVHKLTIETGTCRLLELAREVDPDGSKLPIGFPCAFHERLAKKVAKITGAHIDVNTSSTGCRVEFSLDLG